MSFHQTMPYKVFLDADGQGFLAQGQRPFHWNFQIVGEFDKPREGGVLVAEFEPEWPNRDRATANAVAHLRKRQQEIRAVAEVEAAEIENKVQQLLAIEGPKA